MSYSVKQGNIFGRIGTGVGKGLAEQLPKEIERERLSSGLKQFEQEAGNLTPMQQLARLSSIPGITPQMIQSFGELGKQQAKGDVLKGLSKEQVKPSPFKQPSTSELGGKRGKEAPSITTRNPIEETLKPYIPKTLQGLQQRAGELFEENPALYGNDPDKALNAAQQEDTQNQAISKEIQSQRQKEQDVQSTVQTGLQTQRDALGVKLPGIVYSDIEDKAIDAVRPKSEGGAGLTEQEAIKKYGKELDAVSKDYEGVKKIGSMKLITRSASGNKEALRSLRSGFKKRDDLENFAYTLQAEQNLSPSKSYYLAYPVSDVKELNNEIKNAPTLYHQGDYTHRNEVTPNDQIANKTLKLSEKLAKKMGKEGSPLAIAEELKAKGYDPQVWMSYLDKNRDKLGMTERQGRELQETRDFSNTINDLWMFYFSGLDPLVEQ